MSLTKKTATPIRLQALNLPMIAPATAFRLRKVIIRKPRTFVVQIHFNK
jgi:hypothetical protein